MTRLIRFAAAPAMLAALSLTASPALAAGISGSTGRSAMHAELGWNASEDQIYEQYRIHRHDRYDRYDRYDRRYDRYRGRDRVDAGDILTGVLILGGIAAIASAVRGSERETRYPDARYPDPRLPDARYRERNSSYRGAEVSGLDRAAAMCVESIERDTRVESVDSVDRDAAGWRVTGRLYDGASFSCAIGADGRIQAIDRSDGAVGYGDPNSSASSEIDIYTTTPLQDRQYDDERYRSARARVGNQQPAYPPAALPEGPLPAYPGGPLPGDPDY